MTAEIFALVIGLLAGAAIGSIATGIGVWAAASLIGGRPGE